MRQMLRSLTLVCVVAVAWASPASLADQADAAPAEPSAWDQVLEYYEKAKAAGEQVPQDVYEWARQDLSRIGDWEYLVTSISLSNTVGMQHELNLLGANRWECILIERDGDKSIFVFKRPAKSYLQNLSLSQLLKIVPRGNSDDSGD